MADRIVINFGAETREVEQAGRKMSDVLKDTEDSLNDVGSTGEDSLEKVTKNADEARDSTDKLGGSVGGELTDAFGKFDGTAQGALEGVTDGLSSLAGLIPGVGGLIGAGLGTALSEGVKLFSANVDAEAKASEERVQDMYKAFIDSGLNYYTETQKISAIEAITGDPAALKTATDIANTLGLSVQQVILAQVEAGQERVAVMERIDELHDSELQKGKQNQEIDSDRVAKLYGFQGQFEKLNEEQKNSVGAAEIYRSTVASATGEQRLNNEEIALTNRLLGETPRDIGVKLSVDTSGLDEIERTTRTVRVDLRDIYGRALK